MFADGAEVCPSCGADALMAGHDAGPFTHGTKVMSKWMKAPIEKEEDLEIILPYVVKSYEAAEKEYRANR